MQERERERRGPVRRRDREMGVAERAREGGMQEREREGGLIGEERETGRQTDRERYGGERDGSVAEERVREGWRRERERVYIQYKEVYTTSWHLLCESQLRDVSQRGKQEFPSKREGLNNQPGARRPGSVHNQHQQRHVSESASARALLSGLPALTE